MEKRFSNRSKVLAAAIGAAGLASFGADQSNAALIVDVRATGGTATISNGGKTVVGNAGDTITLSLFARVSGTNGVNDETIQSTYGSVTSVGSLAVNASDPQLNGNQTTLTGFGGTSSQLGSIQDMDSDGDLDLGSAGSSSVGKFFARSASPTPASTVVDAQTGEVLLGTVTETIGNVGSSADLNWILRPNATGGNLAQSALWFQDQDGISYNPTRAPAGSGTPVNVSTVPEPASLGLLALASVGLLGRRRK